MVMADHDKAAGSLSGVEAEAIVWFTRMNGKPSRADRSHFEAWLKADPTHGQAFDDLRTMWSSAGAPGADVAREEEQALSRHLENIRRMRETKSSGKAGGIIGLCLCACLAGSWIWLERPHLLQDLQADYVTARGERRTIALKDGSTILMDADSALDVDIGASERRVRLLRGTAFFTVQRSDVPFVVKAGDGEARVLGTTFDVAMQDDGVSVTLESGSLQVTGATTSQRVVLTPGEGIAYRTSGMGRPEKVDIEERIAWHEGRFVFNNARLGDVLKQIERYRPGRIVVLSDTLAARRVSGSFSIDNPQAALASVQSLVGFQMTEFAGRLVIVRP
ncbi:FecR family protein (plasmid) [Rhizobium sp. NIBRBAC000502774]|nr:FecR family protein [Rhizobium sp. NIBRBAC000502774]